MQPTQPATRAERQDGVNDMELLAVVEVERVVAHNSLEPRYPLDIGLGPNLDINAQIGPNGA